MASEVGIVNAALRKLGQSPITAFDEDSKAARLANERYADIRDDLLSRHPWNFAIRRMSLAAAADSPEWGFQRAFPLPEDYIRVLEVNGEDFDSAKWKVEDGSIVTDLEAPLQIRYVYRVEDPNTMSAGFRAALASLLAAEWAEDLTGDDRVEQSKERKAVFDIAQARSNDGQEGTPDQVLSDEWINSRY